MAETKIGTAVFRHNLSPILAIFRLIPEPGGRFPDYSAGQYIALRRDNCRLTKRVVRGNGIVEYEPLLDAQGNQQRGPVTHSYSISSAPYESSQEGYLEFYVILEMHDTGVPGRLTESLFQIEPSGDNRITYYSKIAGDFTLASRANGFKNVVLVGTGTGLAPFASMVKQLHFEALQGNVPDVRYTLFHANRGHQELGYHQKFHEIEAAQTFDFLYVPSVSRPSNADWENPHVGKGRANNLLRSIFDMPLKEGELLHQAESRSNGVDYARKILDRTIKPILPSHVTKQQLLDRMNPADTVILTCGNPLMMEDIRQIAERTKIQFEQEEW